jgi:SAM-dependent methyltransferase
VQAIPETPSEAAYDPIASGYDLLTADWPYQDWLEAIERVARDHGLRGDRVLDAACGTGKSFLPLLDRGYRVTAVDASRTMAAIAAAKAGGRADVRVADLRALPRYGHGFDLITCLDDVVNHLPTEADVVLALRGLRRNLAPGGLLIFDVNTLAAYRAAPTLVAEDARRVVIWQGEGARLERAGDTGRVRMQVIERAPGGLWRREVATWPHRHYPLRRLRELAAAAGLCVLDVLGQHSGARLATPPDEDVHPKLLLVATGERRDDELAPVS